MQTSPCNAPAQMELGFNASYHTVPFPGRPNTFIVEVTTAPRHRETLLYLTEVAAELTLSIRTVQRLCEEGSLQSCIPGKEHRRVRRRWLDEYKRAKGIV